MKALLSKSQFNFFETGEFASIADRDWDATVKFIRDFPWEAQRNAQFLSVGLTGSSVTIEGERDQFFKICLYHYGWFIVYHVNRQGKIRLKVLQTLDEAIDLAGQFFGETLDTSDFRKYDEWTKRPIKHFKTRSFEYTTNLKRNIWVAGPFIITFILLLIPSSALPFNEETTIGIAIMWSVVLLLCGIPILIFLNYFFYSKRLYLEVSRGSNDFRFGRNNLIKKYNKQDIRRIKSFSANKAGSKGPPWSFYYVYVIEMKNGEFLKFTSLMFSSFTFDYKFPEQHIKDEYLLFPFVNKAKFDPLVLK